MEKNVIKQFGEVNTPEWLRRQMLETLPEAFWSVPHRVLEPCCGRGGFVLDIIAKFMQHLRPTHSSTNTLLDSILSECIVWCDINPECAEETAEAIRQLPEYSPLTTESILQTKTASAIGDSLTMHFPPYYFDAVITNPPFQSAVHGKRKGGYGNKSLWDQFVRKALEEWLKPDGYLLCVHPSLWRKPLHDLWELMTARQLLFLSIHNERDGKRVFGCGTRFDWYLLRNRQDEDKSVIEDENRQVWNMTASQLHRWPFLPNGHLELFEQLFVLDREPDPASTFADVMFSRSAYGTDKRHMSVAFSNADRFRYPCVHSMSQKGTTHWYSSTNGNGHFGVPKVILSCGRYPYPYNDYQGQYGMTQIAFGLPIDSKEEGDAIVSGIQHPVFQLVLQSTKWTTFYIDWKIFMWLKRDFYKYLK